MTAPLVITFAPGSRLLLETDRPSHFPIHRNGPPGTFVILGDLKISLPTDQIVFSEQGEGRVRVGFGGFHYDGIVDGQHTFTRVRELRPEAELSPDRSFTMRLRTEWVAGIEGQ